MRIRSPWFQVLVASVMLTLFAAPFEFAHSETYLAQAAPEIVPQAGSGGIGYPSCQYCPNPKYSEQAREAKYEGVVLLQAVVTVKGRARKIAVVKGPGRLGVEKSATEALRTWRFKPAMDKNGKPVAVVTTVDVAFHLR